MARIPEAEIDRLKREVSVERLVEASGVSLKRMGKDLFGRCPFHADDTASLAVTPAKNLWHCLGACQAGGDVFAWVMRVKGVSFRHAYELLRADPALAAPAGSPVKQTTVRTLPAPVALEADDQALLAQVIDYYHETLKASPEALAYLKTRGIDHPEAVEHFKLGFANRTLGLRLPQKNRKEGDAMRSRLQRLGILRDSGHEHFNGSLVIPVLDAQRQVTEIYGRKITEGLRLGTPKHLYLPREGLGIGRGVWNAVALASSKEVIVCEALIDALTFWCAGYRNVTAAYGVEGFTDDHFAAFKRHGTERILIAYDRDDAGEKAAERLASHLMAEGIEAWRIQFPKGMDANAYALKVGPATKSLGVVIRKSVWLGKGAAPARSEPAVVMRPERGALDASARADSSLAASAAKEELMDRYTPQAYDHRGVDVADCDIELPAPGIGGTQPLADCDRLAVSLPASPVPPALGAEIPMEIRAAEIVFAFGTDGDAHRYRVLSRRAETDVLGRQFGSRLLRFGRRDSSHSMDDFSGTQPAAAGGSSLAIRPWKVVSNCVS